MLKRMRMVVALIAMTLVMSSCSTYNKTMREPNSRVELSKKDFKLSEQVSAEAKATKILGIDFERLFTKKTGNIKGGASDISLASLPVIGNLLEDKTSNYALYELMNANPGYDVVFYPQYEVKVVKPIIGLGFILKITTVNAKARLGKFYK